MRYVTVRSHSVAIVYDDIWYVCKQLWISYIYIYTYIISFSFSVSLEYVQSCCGLISNNGAKHLREPLWESRDVQRILPGLQALQCKYEPGRDEPSLSCGCSGMLEYLLILATTFLLRHLLEANELAGAWSKKRLLMKVSNGSNYCILFTAMHDVDKWGKQRWITLLVQSSCLPYQPWSSCT